MRKKVSKSALSFLTRKEQGDIAGQLGVFFVILCVMMMLYAVVAYSRASSLKLQCDNIARKYLSIMEQEGYLDTVAPAGGVSQQEALISEIEHIWPAIQGAGGTETKRITVTMSSETTTSQVPYGATVNLKFTVKFENPMFEKLAKSNHEGQGFITDFTIAGVSSVLTYEVDMSSTAKW